MTHEEALAEEALACVHIELTEETALLIKNLAANAILFYEDGGTQIVEDPRTKELRRTIVDTINSKLK